MALILKDYERDMNSDVVVPNMMCNLFPFTLFSDKLVHSVRA